jgi:5-methyltetrahydropteroyltriglutamate--homocysteine methyltransferase
MAAGRFTDRAPVLMSTGRILVSHVGSLPRAEPLSDLLIRQEAGETIDAAELAHQVEMATAHVIAKQVEAGVDVGNDGEQSRVGFQADVPRCLCSFGGESRRPPARDRTQTGRRDAITTGTPLLVAHGIFASLRTWVC